MQMRMSQHLYVFLVLFFLFLFFLFVLSYSDLFGFVLSNFFSLQMPACFLMRESKEECGLGRIWRSWGRGNSNQNILYEKNYFQLKKRKKIPSTS